MGQRRLQPLGNMRADGIKRRLAIGCHRRGHAGADHEPLWRMGMLLQT